MPFDLTSFLMGKGQGGGGGTTIVPNPDTDTTDMLHSVKIGNTTYGVSSPCIIGEVINGGEEGTFEVSDIYFDYEEIQNLLNNSYPLAIIYMDVIIPQAFADTLYFSLCAPNIDDNDNPIIKNYRLSLSYDEDNYEWGVDGWIDIIHSNSSPEPSLVIYDFEEEAYTLTTEVDFNDPNSTIAFGFPEGEWSDAVGPRHIPVGLLLRNAVIGQGIYQSTAVDLNGALRFVTASIINDFEVNIEITTITTSGDWTEDFPIQE